MNWDNVSKRVDFPYDGQIKYFGRMVELPNKLKAMQCVKAHWDEKIQEWIVLEA